MTASPLNLELNTDRYVSLMTKLIGETEFLQNNPPKFVPQEDRAIKHLLEVLKPHSTENGGPLTIEHVTYVEGRGNLVIGYTPTGAVDTVSFVGSHLDCVPANPETWERNPFKLTQEGDKLYGRGTTDCLGHVALITDLFLQLAEKKPQLKRSVWAVFIASEENSTIPDVGVDAMLKDGRLERYKNGPIYWIDSADNNPCVGTASAAMWKLRVDGRLFHSGLPHKGINSIELADEVVSYLQKKFYEDYSAHPEEERYKFSTPSTMKPTQITCSEGSINQIPPWTEVKGDIRLTPFYDIEECTARIGKYVEELNNDLSILPCRGPCSKYDITDTATGASFRAKLTFTIEGAPLKGIACNMDSPAFKHLHAATLEVLGESKPFSICGSLPLVGDLQKAGFDIQTSGYGHSHVYHGDNEYCSISSMQNAMKILSKILDKYNS
ncbi:PREDICTED: acetylornithine deacetylase-like [Amphimedon queenslandica]|uniref:Peptidase M20 dimerisation domain-containing protein n=1 Tax=Amphimedon queenslandica TaxID=400682 RepID=A0A1X7VKX5_AMPQE|nr:PREDICTED: acetylornithine deacetylase-like [Amphimedon queenslandica]|eukprot:XP_019863918.1 PREDICTED: acetylornithine deacetylase-like [Amphimedon queenslandica]